MPLDKAVLDRLGSLALNSNHKIIVGVDYGTTFTGASYVSSKGTELSDVILISTWPGPSRFTDTVFKTPSRIAYPADNPRISNTRWGYQVEPGMVGYSWTKLLLDQGTPLTKYDDGALEDASQAGILQLPEGKTAIDVVSDYLAEIYQYILGVISKQITEEALHMTPLEFWFTVPAIWSDQAQDATKVAAQRAGFGASIQRPNDRIFLISEPEAAAITALKKYSTNSIGGSVKVGDGMLVCDCGGGTVDITTYLVNQVFPTLKFEELCTGIGGKCGSTAVDRNFYKLMSDRFGDAFDNLPMRRKGPGSEFMKKFEIIKRDFGASDESTDFELPLNMTVTDPDPAYFDDEERLVILSSDDMRAIFDPVIGQIVSLVKLQIKDARQETGKDVIKRIVLVGGFGDSEYLRKTMRSSFESGENITITIPDSPQAAIVQGAALRGLEGLRSTTKRCRRHYGFEWGISFREGIDDEADSFIHSYTGEKMVSGIMKWMIAKVGTGSALLNISLMHFPDVNIEKGEKYTENYTNHVTVQRTHFESWSLKKSVTFYACDDTQAPERVNEDGVYKVGQIVVDFSNVDLSQFKSKTVDGERLYSLRYKLKVIFGAQEGILKFEAVSQGQTIGTTTINFNTLKYY